MSALWYWYISFALLALCWKCARYIYIGTVRNNRLWRSCLREWFEIHTIDSQVSWIATLVIVWAGGALLLSGAGEKVFGGWFERIPVAPWSAALAGALMEYAAPAALKYIISKFHGGHQLSSPPPPEPRNRRCNDRDAL